MGVERISMNTLFELCTYLQECDILDVTDKNTTKSKKMSYVKPIELSKKRVTGSKIMGKVFNIELRVDILELNEALEVAD